MASYHLTMKPVTRSSGRSAPACAAYRAGERVVDHAIGETWDYSRKQGVEHSEIVLPASAAKRDIHWARDREQLWNAAEAAEPRKDSRVAREWEVALPHELTRVQRVALTKQFADEIANRYGCAVDVALHRPHKLGNQKNYHAHLLATTRTIEADGLGAKTDVELGERDRAKRGLYTGPDELKWMRARCGTLMNEHLREHGHSARVDHRTLAEQGIEREPTVHLGPSVTAMERRGIATEVGNRVREEQRLEQQLWLEKAKELGALERQSLEIRASILDLSLDLKQALAERKPMQANDQGLEITPAAAQVAGRERSLAERLEADVDERASALLAETVKTRKEHEAQLTLEQRRELSRDHGQEQAPDAAGQKPNQERDYAFER